MTVKLSSMRKGETGVLVSIEDDDLSTAISKLGLVPGERFLLSEIAPMGGPLALRLEGTTVAVRKNHADLIWVNKEG